MESVVFKWKLYVSKSIKLKGLVTVTEWKFIASEELSLCLLCLHKSHCGRNCDAKVDRNWRAFLQAALWSLLLARLLTDQT